MRLLVAAKAQQPSTHDYPPSPLPHSQHVRAEEGAVGLEDSLQSISASSILVPNKTFG